MRSEAHPRTFDALVAEHGERVARVCRSILRSDDLAKDAAQETFLRLWERFRRRELPDQPAAWLRRVALTTALDIARRREVRDRAGAPRSVTIDFLTPGSSSPLARASDAELAHELERALTDLPDGQRAIFLLRHRGGLSLTEVAATLDLALPTVKTQFARACLRLQAKLARFSGEVNR